MNPAGRTARNDAEIVIPAVADDGSLVPAPKLDVHRTGQLHLAVSVFVFDPSGRLLVQRRADAKYHSPGEWANTACTHPHWGEPLHDAASRRLREEIGVEGVRLTERLTTEYRADVGGVLVEHERVTFFSGEAGPSVPMTLDAEEVSETAWWSAAELAERLRERPRSLTPWFRVYLSRFPGLAF